MADILDGRDGQAQASADGAELLVVEDILDHPEHINRVLEPLAHAAEQVCVREPTHQLMAAPADAQVDHQAVGDSPDPIGMDRVRESDLALDEVHVIMGPQDLHALMEVILEEEIVTVEEEEEIPRGQRDAQVAEASWVGRPAAQEEVIEGAAPGILLQDGSRPILRGVVDDDHLNIERKSLGLPLQVGDRAVHALQRLSDMMCMVPGGHDNRDLLHASHLLVEALPAREPPCASGDQTPQWPHGSRPLGWFRGWGSVGALVD
jgi:hypothetical protein